jgi:hypothetical protein
MNISTFIKYSLKIVVLIALGLSTSVYTQETSFKHFTLKKESTGAELSQETDLYRQIAKEFDTEYENIGRREAERVLAGNDGLSITGGLNSVGFSYRKPFINFGVTLDRNLAPELTGSKWIVTDTFTIHIDASKVLGNLRDQEIIDLSQENMAAFAGIVFKRKYTWVHFADTYKDGLMRDFEKLFMPFKKLDHERISKLDPNEMIFKEDSITLKAGGLVSAPIYTGVTGTAGVLAKFQQLTRTEVISLPGKDRTLDQVQITTEKTKVGTAGVSLGLQADFLNILKLTLLSYDFSYELQSSYKIYVNLKQNYIQGLQNDDPVAREIDEILSAREGSLKVLAPFVISEEKRVAQVTNHKYNFFLLGGQKSSKTQQIEITTDGKAKTFFRHYYEKIKFTDNLVSRLFASIIYALTHSDLAASKQAIDTKRVTIEYDSEQNLLDLREDLNIGQDSKNEQKLSMTFSSEFITQKTSGTSGKKYRERARFILERFSGVDPIALTLMDKGHLVTPFNVNGKYQVNIDGLRYFNNLSVKNAFSYIDGLCNEYPSKAFFSFRNLFDTCRKNLQNDYTDYRMDLIHDKVSAADISYCETEAKKKKYRSSKTKAFIKACLSEVNLLPQEEWVNIPLWSLKKLTNGIVYSSYSKVHFYNLFGVQNVFFFGTFDAVTSDGRAFTTNFHEGAFKGLGAVDHYMRQENLRAPSSVVIDQ